MDVQKLCNETQQTQNNKMNENQNKVTTLVKNDERSIEFVPYGAADKIKLSVKIIQTMIATPTKSGRTCDDRQAMRFLMLCSAQRLNPFAGDAYLIGYDGKDGPQFSLITAHQAFLKRAEASKDFDGMESGVIVRHKESGDLKDFEGDFFDDQFYDLIGAWSRVHHKSHKIPTLRRAALKTYKKSYGLWAAPENHAMMIVKVAEADALRSTFPTLLGGLYAEGEALTVESEPVNQRAARLVATSHSAIVDAPQAESKGEAIIPPTDQTTAQDELAVLIEREGYTFEQLMKWGEETGNIKDAGSLPDMASIPLEVTKRLLRAQAGLLKGLAEIKGRE